MDRTLRFRRLLADRILWAAGLAVTAAVPLGASCGGKVVADGDPGAGGAGGGGPGQTTNATTGQVTTGQTTVNSSVGPGPTSSVVSTSIATTSISTGSTCGPGQTECFEWPDPGQACPPIGDAMGYFINDCSDNCWAYEVTDGPFFADGLCCYTVNTDFCGVGRPFIVAGAARTAPARSGAGWCADAAPPALDLSAAARQNLAEEWKRDALLEHASVAAFSRFSLELLAAGAPADLVEDAHRAALDEVEHARLCFALATAYAGEPVAPGPFPLGGALELGGDLVSLAASAVIEGCVGETLAAVLAAEQLAAAEDPAVRAALAAIAEDEARHAELAWRTVAWAIATGGDVVRRAVEAAFGRATSNISATVARATALGSEDRAALARHGRLDVATTRTVLARALEEIVLPAAAALVSTAPKPESLSPSSARA